MGVNRWRTIVQKSNLPDLPLDKNSLNVEIIFFAQLYYILFLFFCQENYPSGRLVDW
jgi:hypothetical protein